MSIELKNVSTARIFICTICAGLRYPDAFESSMEQFTWIFCIGRIFFMKIWRFNESKYSLFKFLFQSCTNQNVKHRKHATGHLDFFQTDFPPSKSLLSHVILFVLSVKFACQSLLNLVACTIEIFIRFYVLIYIGSVSGQFCQIVLIW